MIINISHAPSAANFSWEIVMYFSPSKTMCISIYFILRNKFGLLKFSSKFKEFLPHLAYGFINSSTRNPKGSKEKKNLFTNTFLFCVINSTDGDRQFIRFLTEFSGAIKNFQFPLKEFSLIGENPSYSSRQHSLTF